MSKKVAVVILNFNTREFLEKFLPSVCKTSYPNTEIIIADNASSDDSVQFVKDNYPLVKIILLEKNYGFTGGYNRALKQVNADYYVLLNSDVEVDPNWIEPMVNLMESNPSIAAIQPKLLALQQNDTFEYAGASGGYIDRFGFPFCRGRIFDHLEKDQNQYNDNKKVMIVSHTVDPETDNVATLKQYAEANGVNAKQWLMLTGDSKQIYGLARKSYFAVLDEPSPEGPDFVHTENFVLVDAHGRLRGFYDGTSKQAVDKLIADIDFLLEEE